MNLFLRLICLLFLRKEMKKVKPKKYLGQHFLKDEIISKNIVQLLDNKQNFFLEIGPGTGILTKYLIKKKTDFNLIEIDINHKKRIDGKTNVYQLRKIPSIAIRNAIGLLKIKFS